jgi:hypothetical protein
VLLQKGLANNADFLRRFAMKTLRFGLFSVLLPFALGVHAADTGQDGQAPSSHKTGEVEKQLPTIFDEENIPAFLRTDPCDTGDS